MKIITCCLTTLFICGLVVCQTRRPSKQNKKIKIKATILAFDRLAALSNITFAPKSLLLIFRTDELLKGQETARYLKVIYTYFGDESKTLQDLTTGSRRRIKVVLSRNKECDSTLKDAKYSRSFSLDGKKELEPVLRLKDMGGLQEVPEGLELPCYKLNKKGLKN